MRQDCLSMALCEFPSQIYGRKCRRNGVVRKVALAGWIVTQSKSCLSGVSVEKLFRVALSLSSIGGLRWGGFAKTDRNFAIR